MLNTDDFVKAIFKESIIQKAMFMFKSDYNFNGHKDRMPLEMFDISFRLFKPTELYVNLEFLVSSPQGKYFKPVGFIGSNGSVYIINEFLKNYNNLKKEGIILEKATFLMSKIDALIAAFSMETIGYVYQIFKEFNANGWEPKFENGIMIPGNLKFDKRYKCNGFNCELIFCNEGYPQFYLDDDDISGAFGAYIQNKEGNVILHPMIEYQEVFDNLRRLGLLTAFNRI